MAYRLYVADEVIFEAAEACGKPPVLAVKGNHDRNVPFAPPIRDTHLQVHEIDGFTIGGHGHQVVEVESRRAGPSASGHVVSDVTTTG